tara:strand:+ start:1025 stop:1348 length:324 start_codon:yes stop_codon:yes gene_type:complete
MKQQGPADADPPALFVWLGHVWLEAQGRTGKITAGTRSIHETPSQETFVDTILFFARSVGPFVLLALLVGAWLYTRRSSKRTDQRAERGARELREELSERREKDVDL